MADSCGNCQLKKESYQKELDEEMRKLVTFRGHGCGVKPGVKANIQENIACEEPFTEEEIVTVIKLMLVGAKKVHFTARSDVSVTFNGVTIETKIERKYFARTTASILISTPDSSEQVVYIATSEQDDLKKISELGNEEITFVLRKKMETITWAIHLPDGLNTSNFLEKICDPCATCYKNKNEIRDWFHLEMKRMITFRGHGSLYNSGNNRYHNSHNFNRIGRFKSKIGFEDDSDEWEAFEDDEILTLLKLIGFGITKFNFTIKSDSEIDVEYEGYQLKTQFIKLMRDSGYELKLTLKFPEDSQKREFTARLLDYKTHWLLSSMMKESTATVWRMNDPRKITWSCTIHSHDSDENTENLIMH